MRWEPRSASPEWNFSHHMATVGEGYVWPNVTVFSDGERIALVAKPSLERKETNFRYVGDIAVVVSGREFESAIDQFVEQVIGQLRAESRERRIWIGSRRSFHKKGHHQNCSNGANWRLC